MKKVNLRYTICALALLLVLGMVQPAFALSGGPIQRVSVASDGTAANDDSWNPNLSADGRFIAFASEASNLVPGDTNGASDIFVHDRQTGTTERVSVASDGTQANNESYDSAISDDGRYVAFSSDATNLVSGDTNGYTDVFVHDRQTGETERVSVASNGSQANNESQSPTISRDGRFVAFNSYASNLIPGGTNGTTDIFVHDRQTGTTERISIASDGSQANGGSSSAAISSDGHFVAFASYASNLVPDDTNSMQDIFLHDRQSGETIRVSIASDGTQANNYSENPAVSEDGRYVAFVSQASNLVPGDTNGHEDIFVKDRWMPYFLPLAVR